MPINSAVKLKLKMRKVYAPQTKRVARKVSIFMHILYAYCKLLSGEASAHSMLTPTSETPEQSSKATGAQMLRRRFALCPLCLWPLSKFHVRNRHKSYGHILNLCVSRPHPHPLIPFQHLIGLLATHFAAVFCGLDYLVCGTSIAGEAAGDFILIFAVSRLLNFSAVVVVIVSVPQSFLIKTECCVLLKAFCCQ